MTKDECSTSWTKLVTVISQDRKNWEILMPYGTEICKTLQGKQKIKINGTINYKDIGTAFDDLKTKIIEFKEQVKKLEKEKGETDNKNNELRSQNYKQGVGLGLGIPAAGAAGAGAVIGLPLLVKLLKGVFTRS